MTGLTPSLKLLRVLAGEGSFHIYRLLRDRRVFLFTKCLLTTFACFRGRGSETGARSIAFVKGANQLRYFWQAHLQLEAELGALQLYASAPLPTASDALLLPRMSLSAFAQQVVCLLMLLLTGKRRYLNLYLLAFASAMRKAVDTGLRNIESFVCFNDQPYDVAAIVHALHGRKGCRTIVVQHGLILSQNFYFPTVAKEFWAWGELSKQHYRAWDKDAQLVVKGRYREDAHNKARDFVWPPADRPVRILVAPSFFHDEVKHILTELDRTLSTELKATARVAIKFHPATKLLWRLRRWCQQHAPWLKEEHEPMEHLATQYDILVTKNSTSAVDFLLRGKPIISVNLSEGILFPSQNYSFDANILQEISKIPQQIDHKANIQRLSFLQSGLNV